MRSESASGVEIGGLPRERAADACRALARAFVDDPAFTSLWPDPARRARALERLMGVAVAHALRRGDVDALTLDGAVAGVAAWLPPGQYPLSAREQVRATPRMLGVAAAAPRAFPRLGRFGANIDAAFPADRPWYLAVVGVVPEAQGRGLGTRLLRPGLDRCDATAGDCYLETDTAAAARLYERLGFATLEAGAQLLPGGPTHWRMRRPTGGASPTASSSG